MLEDIAVFVPPNPNQHLLTTINDSRTVTSRCSQFGVEATLPIEMDTGTKALYFRNVGKEKK